MPWPSTFGVSTLVMHESVKYALSSLSPSGSMQSSPRPSEETTRSSPEVRPRRSLDLDWKILRPSLARIRRTLSGRRRRSPSGAERGRERERGLSPLAKPDDSLDSYALSPDQELDAPSMVDFSEGTPASGSQILRRSDVFQLPTIPRPPQPGSFGDAHSGPNTFRRRSEEIHRPEPMYAEIRIHPPSRSAIQHTRSKTLATIPLSAHHHVDMDGANTPGPNQLQLSRSSPTLHGLARAGAYPLARATSLAGYLKQRSKKVSNLLASESMGYLEKVSGMWVGARRHYREPVEMVPDDQLQEMDEDETDVSYGDRFRAHFSRPATEKLQATFYGYLHRVLPLYGKIYISSQSFCFRTLLPGTRTKMILPLKNIENVDREKGFFYGYSGMVVVVRGKEELFFEFSSAEARDDCTRTVSKIIEAQSMSADSGSANAGERISSEKLNGEGVLLQVPGSEIFAGFEETSPLLFDDPRASILNFQPTEPLRFTCLTIGSRGDVQPYVALCKGLMAEGHQTRIATHAEFEPWVRGHGIDFAPVDGDPAELMRICVEHGMFTYSFMKEATSKFRDWIDDLLRSSWKACQDTDVLIESPSAMAGIHIAEALRIPYFRAFTMPWTRTRAYPHAFAVPEHKMGGTYNYLTYVMFDAVFWKAIAGQVNRWRKSELGLPRTSLEKLQPNKVPFLYNFSPMVVPRPLDYSEWIRVTGYWFLHEGSGWTPPDDLRNFIAKARHDQKKIVYVGFGSIVVSDPAALTQTVIDSVLQADVRCILSKGWSDRLGGKETAQAEVPLPDCILPIKSAPHDWLFAHIDAAAHHGGAGTTGASLRAGIPTIIKPFFGDQYFFGSRVEDLGVGICIKKLNVGVFSHALSEATTHERMIGKAKALGARIRKEDGVGNAIQAIYRDLDYAKSLVKKPRSHHDEGPDDLEDSWTFIGEESHPEMVRQMMDSEPVVPRGYRGLRIASAFGRRCRRAVSPSSSTIVSP
ncbi:MAG: Sterol 3-beta-glucosyltransferase [Phylliscum demangeonii]|nr:MAG: Sterol 3-beta-glucosyltransferase [Phylliscum demangeonii]